MDLVAWLLVVPTALLLAVFTIEILVGLAPSRLRRGEPFGGQICVLIPAHDEAAGIGATIDALRADAPDGADVLVVADNCTDDTAAVARRHGAAVVERHDPTRRGKGYALAFGRDHLAARAGGPPGVVAVLDADCRLLPGSLSALGAAALAQDAPVQAVNLIRADRAAPPMVQISSFAMVVKNLYRSRGMQRLGGAALLTGTGMAFPWRDLAGAALATGALAEDLMLGVEMTRAGRVPRLIPEAGVRSAPAAIQDALAQRRRWEHGFLETVRQRALPLLMGAMARVSRPEMLLALHLLVPPLALLVMIAGLVLLLAAGLAVAGGSAAPVLVMAVALGLAGLAVLLAWLGEGRQYLSAAALARAPLYVVWKLPVYVGFFRKARVEWSRTPRAPEKTPESVD